MSTREAAPSIVQFIAIALRANMVVDQLMGWGAPLRDAARDQVRPCSSDGILENVRQK